MPCQACHQEHTKLGFLQLPSTVQPKPSEPGNSLEHVTKMWRSSVWNSLCIIQLDESMPCLVSEGPWWPELLGGRNTAEGGPGCWYAGLKGHVLGPAVGISVILLLWQIALITDNNPILGYLKFSNRWDLLRKKNCNWGTGNRVSSLAWESLLGVIAKLNSDSCVPWYSTVLSIRKQSPRLATLCHWVGCLTFCVIYIFLIVIFTVAGESEGLPLLISCRSQLEPNFILGRSSCHTVLSVSTKVLHEGSDPLDFSAWNDF